MFYIKDTDQTASLFLNLLKGLRISVVNDKLTLYIEQEEYDRLLENTIAYKLRVYIPLSIVIILVLTGAWYWYRDYSKYITTDDAHVDADTLCPF